jgi:hypothetical protein
MADVRFYLDENVQLAVAEQLRRHSIQVVTVRDMELLGDEDSSHLTRATQMGHVLCTHDYDFVYLASTGIEHAGLIIGQQDKHKIGDWVKGLILIHAVYSVEEMQNRIEYL